MILEKYEIGSLHCDVAERSGDSPTVAPSERSSQKLVAGRGVAEGSAVSAMNCRDRVFIVSAHRGLVLFIVSSGQHSAVIVFN